MVFVPMAGMRCTIRSFAEHAQSLFASAASSTFRAESRHSPRLQTKMGNPKKADARVALQYILGCIRNEGRSEHVLPDTALQRMATVATSPETFNNCLGLEWGFW